MNAGELSISVRLRHPVMEPEAITSAMGVEPGVAHPVGGKRMTPIGRELSGHYSETYWAFGLEDRSDADLDDAIANANVWVQRRESFVVDFVRSGGSLEYYVTIESTDRLAFVFGHDRLAECVRFQAAIAVEVLRPPSVEV